MCMCTLKNHVEKVCTLVSQNNVYFKFVYSVMAPHLTVVVGVLIQRTGKDTWAWAIFGMALEGPQGGPMGPGVKVILVAKNSGN